MSKPSSRIKLGLLAIPILGIMTGNAALSLDMYLPAFPAIANDFGVVEGDVQVTMSTFLAGFALGQLFYGPLADNLGRRPVILVALAAYGLISALCAMSSTIDQLTLLRAAQGLAGASGAVLGRAIIRDVYEGSQLARAMSMLMLVMTAAPMAAPLLGSFILELWDWRATFWTLAAYAMIWSFLIVLTIPETLPPERRRSIHPIAILKTFGSVVTHLPAMGYTLTVSFGFAGMFVYIAATPFLYMDNFGISPKQYALFFAVNIGGMALGSMLNRRLVAAWGIDRLLILFTTILVISALFLLASAITGFAGIWGLAIPLFFYVGSLSPIAANGITGTLQFFGPAAGTASSVFGVFQFGLGSLAAIAIARIGGGTPIPMAMIILVCAILSLIAHRMLANKKVG